MFVRKLDSEQQCIVVASFLPKTVYRYEKVMHYGKKEYLEVFMYDSIHGNYAVCLYDTYLSCAYKGCNEKLEEMARSAFKALYYIFGEDYKNYFLEQVNSIFN